MTEPDPSKPTSAPPGTTDKLAQLIAREAAGLPLWDAEDADHSAYDSEAAHERWTKLRKEPGGNSHQQP